MKLTPLILIHGYPLDHNLWREVVRLLGPEVEVHTPDLPGFGDNPVEAAEPSIDLYADGIARLLELHSIPRAVVAGMSMGGYVALSFAERHGTKLAGLGLVSTQTQADTEEVRKSRREMIARVGEKGPRIAAEAIAAKLLGPSARRELEREAFGGAENAGVAGIVWALESMAQRPDRTEMTARLTVPVMIVHGSEDKLVPIARARDLAKKLAQAEYLELPGVGHLTPLEEPLRVAEALRKLVKRASEAPLIPPKDSTRPGIVWGPTERGL